MTELGPMTRALKAEAANEQVEAEATQLVREAMDAERERDAALERVAELEYTEPAKHQPPTWTTSTGWDH